MRLTDPVYGFCTVEHPLLTDLLGCPSMQRLAGVDQGGMSRAWFPGAEHSRLEHSAGVMLLLARYGASLAEQAAGLIHDVSHSAFSHCMDYVLDEGSPVEQSLQDDMHRQRVLASEIPGILAGRGLDAEMILDEVRFPLLERDLPDLCADRIDYALRMAVHAGLLDRAGVERVLDGLAVRRDGNGTPRWVFSGAGAARRFAELFAELNGRYFSGLPSAAMFRSVGDCLRHALGCGYLRRDDLWGTDDQVLDALRVRLEDDARLDRLWRRMWGWAPVRALEAGGLEVRCKSRAVDPLCIEGADEPVRLSALQPDWGGILAEQARPRTWRLRFEDADG